MLESTNLQPPDQLQTAHLFREIRHELLQVLHDLTPEQWERPTVCPGWTVRDIALHLLGIDMGNLSRRRDGFSYHPDAFPGDPSTFDLVAFVIYINEEWVQATRRLSPRLICTLLAFVGEEMDDYFVHLDGAAVGEAVSWAGPGPAPVWLDIAREYTDRWVHQQQIRDAVECPGMTEPRYLAPVLATFVHALPHTLRHEEPNPGTFVRLIITGDAGGAWVAVRTSGAWVLGREFPGEAAATVTIDQDTAWRLYTRGVTPEEARPKARLDGDRALGELMLRMVSIIV
jgi:uncharacterized protein (TIGR03083 family)